MGEGIEDGSSLKIVFQMRLLEAVEVEDILARNLSHPGFRNIFESVSQELLGARPGRVGVWIVGRPGNILLSKDLASILDIGVLKLKRGHHIALHILAGQHRQRQPL